MAFLKAIREVLAIGPSKQRLVNPLWKGTQVDEATLLTSADIKREIAATRESLRKGTIKDER